MRKWKCRRLAFGKEVHGWHWRRLASEESGAELRELKIEMRKTRNALRCRLIHHGGIHPSLALSLEPLFIPPLLALGDDP